MGAQAIVGIEDLVSGSRVGVGFDGAARTAPGASVTGNAAPSLSTTWAELVAANDARRQIQIQNQSLVNIWILLAPDSISTTGAYLIVPGTTYSFPSGVSWRGAIQGKAASPTSDVAVIEFNEPDEEEE